LELKKIQYLTKKGPPAICQGRSLPKPVRGIPCDLKCEDGHFFSTNSSQCESCAAGTFATSDVSFTNWDSWPSQFKRSCSHQYADKPCELWQLKGSYIDSGSNPDYITTILSQNIEVRNSTLELTNKR
jgi:hypothetical protein